MCKISKALIVTVFSLALSGLALPVFAQTDTANPVVTMLPDRARQTPAGKFIQDLGDRVIAILADKSLTPKQRHQKYYDFLHQAFDMPTIGHFVLGRAWNTATPEQRQEYMKLFEALVVKIYGDRLNLYSDETFQVKSVRLESDRDSVVGSEVVHPRGGAPTPIDWRVRLNNGKFAVIDVIVGGVSQSVTQRQEYASILMRNNGDINALLDSMREKVRQQDDTVDDQTNARFGGGSERD